MVCCGMWDYNDFDVWKDLYPECGGESQSPIDISSSQSQCIIDGNNPLYLKWFLDNNEKKFLIRNAGHSIKSL